MRYGCLTIAAIFTLSGCDEPSMLPSGGIGSEHLVLDAGAGNYSSFLIPYLGKQLHVTARLSEPRRDTKWVPLMKVCVQGANFRDKACVNFMAPRGNVGQVESVAGYDEKTSKSRQVGTTFRIDQVMTIVIKPETKGYSVELDGVQLYSAPTDFEVVGYAVLCSSARCEFVLR